MVIARRTATRRKQAVKIAGTLSVLLIVGVLAWPYLPGPGNPPLGGPSFHAGIACADVVRLAQEYLSGTIDSALGTQIRLHLAECSRCRAEYERMGWKPTDDFPVPAAAELPSSKQPPSVLIAQF